MMRRLLAIVLAVLALAVISYGCDYLYARWRHEPFWDVRIDRFLAIYEKFNKIDYQPTDPITERCVYSLFPHFGHNPCWYVKRHTVRYIRIGG